MSITTEIQLHAFSLPGYMLPTFQKAKLRTVTYGFLKLRTAKYLIFKHYVGDFILTSEYYRVT